MPQISFALINNDNLKNKHLKIKQIESVIEVTGQLDPYQLQKIRDHVSDSVMARRKNINEMIAKHAHDALSAKDVKQRQAIMLEVAKTLQQQSAAFDKTIQQKITAFCQKDEEMAAAAKTSGWKFAVNTLMDVGSLLWNTSEVVAETGGALATGGATAVLALKKVFDLCLEFEKFVTTQGDAWRGLEGQEKRLNLELAKIKGVKKGAPVPLSDIQAAESALAPLGPKIDVLEKQTRLLAGKLDQMMKEQIAKAVKDKATVKKIEDAVHAAVVEVAAFGEAIGKKHKAQQSAKDSIKSAMAKAKSDPWSFITWARKLYEDYNDAADLSEEMKDVSTAAKQLKIVLQKAMEDEED